MKTFRFVQYLALALLGVASILHPSLSRAAEPDAALIAKAQEEGRVVLYTELIVDQIVRPLAAAFKAKYGITVEYNRFDSQDTVLRLTNEQKAGRTAADVWSLTSGLTSLIDAGVAERFDVPHASELPEAYRDPDRYWVASHISVLTGGVNTDLVPEADRPRSFEDLLSPKWTGKLVWKPNDTAGAPGFIGNVLLSMGEERGMEYLRALSKQNIKILSMSGRAILDQVIAGEYPIVIQVSNHHAAISQRKGAPVDWLRIQPASVIPGLVGLVANARHPNAARLFIDFIISVEGQQIIQKAFYLPARADVPALIPALSPDGGHFTATVFNPKNTEANLERWNAVFNELFR